MLTDAHMGGMEEMGAFYDHCLESLYPPGSCGAFCNGHTFQCFLEKVQESCCDEGGQNCNADSYVPERCPVGCALNFPDFLEVCRDHVTQEMPDRLAAFEQFSEGCMETDGLAIIEYLIDLRHRGCTVDLTPSTNIEPNGHRLLQLLMGFIGTESDTCPWDHVDDYAQEVDEICCGTPSSCTAATAHEAPSSVVLPPSCSLACAVALHEFNATCREVVEALLGPTASDRRDSLVAFEAQCMAEAEANMYFILHALDTAVCPTNASSQSTPAPIEAIPQGGLNGQTDSQHDRALAAGVDPTADPLCFTADFAAVPDDPNLRVGAGQGVNAHYLNYDPSVPTAYRCDHAKGTTIYGYGRAIGHGPFALGANGTGGIGYPPAGRCPPRPRA